MVSGEKFWLLATPLNILFEFSLPATGAGNYYLVKWFKNSFDLRFIFFFSCEISEMLSEQRNLT